MMLTDDFVQAEFVVFLLRAARNRVQIGLGQHAHRSNTGSHNLCLQQKRNGMALRGSDDRSIGSKMRHKYIPVDHTTPAISTIMLKLSIWTCESMMYVHAL